MALSIGGLGDFADKIRTVHGIAFLNLQIGNSSSVRSAYDHFLNGRISMDYEWGN